jgi:amidase
VLRAFDFALSKAALLRSKRDQLKPEVIWNIEEGLKLTVEKLERAEAQRVAMTARTLEFFETYDLLLSPGASTPPFDVELRMPATIDGKKLENYLGSSLITAATTMMALPSIAVPCGFDRHGRPVGLQMVGSPRGEAALLQAAVLFEQMMGLSSLVPIDPRPGAVPPTG